MVESTDSRTKTAASNINNVMKMNLKISSQILSKNTNEIVSNCISKIYKEMPNKFHKSLQQLKVGGNRIENPGPLRAWKSQEKRKQLQAEKMAAKNGPSAFNSKSESSLLQHVMKTNRRKSNAQVATSRKLLKSPNFKIYSSRRFGSSASNSSNISHFRHVDDSRRNSSTSKKFSSTLLRLANKPQVFLHTDATSIVVPPRNQKMRKTLNEKPTYFNISPSVEQDLMDINDMMKSRMRTSGYKEAKKPKEPITWTYPPPPEIYKIRNEQKVSQSRLNQQFNRLQRLLDTKPTGNYSQVQGVFQNSPALSSKVIRKHLSHMPSKSSESPKPKPVIIHDPLSSLQYFANRKTPDINENLLRGIKEGTHNASTFAKLQQSAFKPLNNSPHYKVNGRIASKSIAPLSGSSGAGSEIRSHRIKYLNLTMNQAQHL